MTNNEILEKAIEKAIKNGWSEHEDWGEIVDIRVHDKGNIRGMIWLEYPKGDGEGINIANIIFSHDFAKAFWGEGKKGYPKHILDRDPSKPCPICHEIICPPHDVGKVDEKGWQYHLQQMVLEEDPIKYLEQFI